tara:strand:- start:3759 stop:4931 length:1173 start_codon:yes stop_codon:yes gene_type:complete
MATFLKPIQQNKKRIVNDRNVSSVFTMAFGSELKFTKLDSVNDAGFKTNKYNSLWSMFNLNSEKIFDSYNVDYSDGGMISTLWESILDAYNTNGMVMFEVSDQNFRKSINGQNIEIKIPLSGGTFTGTTSATTLYSSYIDTESLKVKSTTSVCDPWKIDMAYSEPNRMFTNDFGIGYVYQMGTNPTEGNIYDSGLTLLMSGDWSPWSGSSTAKTWSDGYNVVNKYTKEVAPLITPNGPNRDVAAGALFNNSGIGFIWAESFVNNFDWSGGTGGTGTTMVTFASSEAYLNASDIDTNTKLQVDLIMDPRDFNTSLNQSYIEDSITNGSNCNVAYNTITLNDSQGRCLVIAKSTEPIVKSDGDYSIVTVDIPIDGPLVDSLQVIRGCVYGSC